MKTLVSALVLAAVTAATQVLADGIAQQVSLEAQSLSKALVSLSRQTDTAIFATSDTVKAIQAPSVNGVMTVEEALNQLLVDSSLTYEQKEDGSYVVNGPMDQSAPARTKTRIKDKQAGVIDEVIVTAEKRAQNIQDVPIAISALSAEALQNRGISTPEDLQIAVPGLTIGKSDTPANSQVTIRGVGMENETIGGDPGVPLHIDGHYVQSGSFVLHDFLDIERVEVLRGPQGTLYGRNAVGGSINIITIKPTEQFEGNVGVDLGNYGKRNLQAVISGPITATMRGRLAVADEKRDGYVENPAIPGDESLTSDYTQIRGGLEIDLTDNINILVSGYDYDNKGSNAIRIPQSVITDPRKVSTDSRNIGRDEKQGASVDVSWDIGPILLKSLSAYNDSTTFTSYDGDGTTSPGFAAPILVAWEFETFTQELQLLSNTDSKLNWIAGIYYYDESSKIDIDIFSPFFLFRQLSELEASSIATFGQIDYDITDKVQISLGIRYTEDEKEIRRGLLVDAPMVAGNPVPVPTLVPADDSWSQVTYKLGINYFASEDVMLYASFSTGYKSGGFNGVDFEGSYDAETVDALQLGLKSQWFDNRLQTNIATFYYDYADKQESRREIVAISPITSLPIVSSSIENAGAATSYGAELELQASLFWGFSIDTAISYLKAKYDKFETVDLSNLSLGLQNLSGNELNRSPQWTFYTGIQYDWFIGQGLGSISARIDYSWSDEYYARPFNLESDIIPSYARINARLSWVSDSEDWKAEFYVLNIDDDDDVTNFFEQPDAPYDHFLKFLPPRTYGLRVRYSF